MKGDGWEEIGDISVALFPKLEQIELVLTFDVDLR
jgi:hypothetical protein